MGQLPRGTSALDIYLAGAAQRGRTWRAARDSQVATIPMGYGDGLSRALSNKGQVLVLGRRAPIVGAVSMDVTSVDVTDAPGVQIGDEVVVLGHQRGPLGEVGGIQVALEPLRSSDVLRLVACVIQCAW
jgi:hypothetical protein